MKLFSCGRCQQVVFFDNERCGVCDLPIGYHPAGNVFITLERDEQGDGAGWRDASGQSDGLFRLCGNAQHGVCNWLCDDGTDDTYCRACRHNKIIPDLTIEGNETRWEKLELAKHRMFYSLVRLGLPAPTRLEDPEGGLEFDFKGQEPDGTPVLTGHADGIITIALREADDIEREKMRVSMGEYYRTLLGHFRHEIGHFYWNVLVRDAGCLDACRAVFGDDRADYNEALQTHYANGPRPGWQNDFVSAYAASHPWEDFAESWAHYLHIVDALETASSYGMSLRADVPDPAALTVAIDFDPYAPGAFDRVRDAWFPLASVETALNRSMGLGEFYPFLLNNAVLDKVAFIHRLVHGEVPRDEVPA
ncbi:hypothetical protein AA103196_1688 [Ameyamaea chiangmaiensis NBRC 103196]|uniref:Putative zinc-binding metallopeptidase n=1 Tax=Ameyamaea chiangmaiensis TaxID=442969 RepID=A0A850P637_9PROT|nr:putative zinc-binding metallopeptidase [Ameyamaea chiangmaiensis]MBS4074046.1 putative zinc-binding metallopeptidase [Ameyamaea chiangmaiensis]NVN39398.1 putative zinc-binding metallopeptidase [Ameyamaea chiangmaiensis]GBQ67451.1 hypothetical protein AA103196_1688 [Ameyamaea chiangmaiensis NBRC 103196]